MESFTPTAHPRKTHLVTDCNLQPAWVNRQAGEARQVLQSVGRAGHRLHHVDRVRCDIRAHSNGTVHPSGNDAMRGSRTAPADARERDRGPATTRIRMRFHDPRRWPVLPGVSHDLLNLFRYNNTERWRCIKQDILISGI